MSHLSTAIVKYDAEQANQNQEKATIRFLKNKLTQMSQADKTLEYASEIGFEMLDQSKQSIIENIYKTTDIIIPSYNSQLVPYKNPSDTNNESNYISEFIKNHQNKEQKRNLKKQIDQFYTHDPIMKKVIQDADKLPEINKSRNMMEEELLQKFQDLDINTLKHKQLQLSYDYSADQLVQKHKIGKKWLAQVQHEKSQRLQKYQESLELDNMRRETQEKAKEEQLELEKEKLKEIRKKEIDRKAKERLERQLKRQENKEIQQKKQNVLNLIENNGDQGGEIFRDKSNDQKEQIQKRLHEIIKEQIAKQYQEEREKLLEERRNKLNSVSVSVDEMKSHQLKYQRKLNELQYVKQMQRFKEQEQKQDSQENSFSPYRNQYHKIIEQEDVERKTKLEKERQIKVEQIKKRNIYSNLVTQDFKPKISENLSLQLQAAREKLARSDLKERMQQSQQNPYKDYLKELRSIKSEERSSALTNDSRNSISIHGSSKIKQLKHYDQAKSHSELRNSQDNDFIQSKISKIIDKTQRGHSSPQNTDHLSQKSINNQIQHSIKRNQHRFEITSQNSSQLQTPYKPQDYLTKMRQERVSNFYSDSQAHNQSQTEISSLQLKKPQNWTLKQLKHDISKSEKNMENFNNLAEKIKLVEDRARRKEKLHSINKQSGGGDQDNSGQEEIDNIYLQAINTKLAILDNL
eukprot:403338039